MKNVFKKISLLSSAALVALGICSPMASAVPPTETSLGIHYDQVGIAPGTLKWSPSLTLASGLRFNGSNHQLITALTNQVPTDATLYLRVADSEDALPSSSSDWVAYSTSESLANSALKRSQVGNYHIFWYLDGGNSGYEDINEASDLQDQP